MGNPSEKDPKDYAPWAGKFPHPVHGLSGDMKRPTKLELIELFKKAIEGQVKVAERRT